MFKNENLQARWKLQQRKIRKKICCNCTTNTKKQNCMFWDWNWNLKEVKLNFNFKRVKIELWNCSSSRHLNSLASGPIMKFLGLLLNFRHLQNVVFFPMQFIVHLLISFIMIKEKIQFPIHRPQFFLSMHCNWILIATQKNTRFDLIPERLDSIYSFFFLYLYTRLRKIFAFRCAELIQCNKHNDIINGLKWFH